MALPIGFFMPLPLAMMIPFMGVQSAVMAKQFGENFQYGKRRISAMSNEEFNRLTPKILMENANVELKAMIPSMEASITEMRTFQTFLIREFIAMIKEAIGAGVGELVGGIGTPDEGDKQYWEHFFHGHRGSKAHQEQFLEKELARDIKKQEEEIVAGTSTTATDSSLLFGKTKPISPRFEENIEKAKAGLDIAGKQAGFGDTETKFVSVRIFKTSDWTKKITIRTEMTLNALSNLIRSYELALKRVDPRHQSGQNIQNSLSLLKNVRKRLWNV